jgi:redox-sensitive bicupin YhaK (pirin superfamily)
LKLLAGVAATAGCARVSSQNAEGSKKVDMNPVLRTEPLGFPWRTPDPFLFCVHHDDQYPAGNARFGPAPALLEGRHLGEDFQTRDGWRMYHGREVPGFPQHPHRGFETVTVVRRGLLDHSDSMGASARYGGGDVQWLTAGNGILHAEMFPLLNPAAPNPVELFQIWINLRAADKKVQPYFAMLWNETVPRVTFKDDHGRTTEVTLVAGKLGDTRPPSPPPNSWASKAESEVAIWTIKLSPKAKWTLPPSVSGVNRRLYFFRGSELHVHATAVIPQQAIDLHAEKPALLEAGDDGAELLMLQGRPINEPVVQYGPFVMNSREEIQETFREFQRTRFGGWPWDRDDPVHGQEPRRFAKFADGRIEKPVPT